MGTTRESFGARPASTVQIAATTASASVALAGGNPIADQVRVVGGATDCRVEFGKSTVATTKPNGATPGSALVKAGQTEVFTVPAGTTHVAAACDTGTATLEFTPGQGSEPGMSVRGQGVAAAIAAAQQAVAAGSLILPDPYTVDTLPDPSGCPDMYATVTDLFGVKRDKVLACKVGASWYWQPVRPDHTATQAANASPTLTCLKSPSFLVLTGTLTASRTITLSTAYAYPGAAFDIAMAGTLGLFGLTIAGLSLGATLSLLANGRRRVFFDGTAWQSYA